MPVKQRLAKGRAHRVTAEAQAAYHADDRLGLHLALGLKPWQPSPLEADTPEPPAWSAGPWHDAWTQVADLRGELSSLRTP